MWLAASKSITWISGRDVNGVNKAAGVLCSWFNSKADHVTIVGHSRHNTQTINRCVQCSQYL
jgi:hypothetical protein